MPGTGPALDHGGDAVELRRLRRSPGVAGPDSLMDRTAEIRDNPDPFGSWSRSISERSKLYATGAGALLQPPRCQLGRSHGIAEGRRLHP
jgi:hypothetical protein